MERLGLQLMGEPAEQGQLLLLSSHNPYLVLLAGLVAFAACLATLYLVERAGNADRATRKTVWRWIAVGCLASGIWAMHFICILAFAHPVATRYSLGTAIGALLLTLIAAIAAVQALHRTTYWRSLHQLLKFALCIGAAVAMLSIQLTSIPTLTDPLAAQSLSFSANSSLKPRRLIRLVNGS